MLTLEVLLALREGQRPDTLDEPLAREAAQFIERLPASTKTRVAHNLRHHRDDALKAGNSLTRFDEYVMTGLVPDHTRIPITSFDSVLEVSVPEGTDIDLLTATVEGLVDRLRSAVDPSRSAIVVGTDHSIMDGTGSLQLFVGLRRVPTATHEQFCDWWLNELVVHTTKTPGKSAYRQLHADPQLTIAASKAAGVEIDDLDGVALEFYPDIKQFYSAVEWANQPRAAIVEAENQMIAFDGTLAIVTYAAA